jgi:short-subunit dehydrogenase
LITGASGGLGLEFSKILARKHYDLVLAARSEDKLNDLKDWLEDQYDIRVFVCPVDLSVKDAALTVFNFTQEQGLSIDVLINNVGSRIAPRAVTRKFAGKMNH